MQPQPWSQLRRPRQPVVQIRELSPCQRVVMALQQQQRARATRWPQQTWLNESVVGRSLPHTSSRYKGLARPRYTAQSTHHTMTFKQWLISDALSAGTPHMRPPRAFMLLTRSLVTREREGISVCHVTQGQRHERIHTCVAHQNELCSRSHATCI
jgi:hypothetical protein